jgi:DNA-binding MarR family transcriptional regulator
MNPITGFDVLEHLYDNASAEYDQLRQELNIGPTAYELLVKGLERNGLISVITNDGERRIAINGSGRRRYQAHVLETIDISGLEPQQ